MPGPTETWPRKRPAPTPTAPAAEEAEAAAATLAPAADMSDGQHCRHWYDDDGPCCRCGYDGPTETPCRPSERSTK